MDDVDLRLETIRYIDESKDIADEMCERLDIDKRVSGEPLPDQLRRIKAAIGVLFRDGLWAGE